MKILILYFSQTGNTEKIASAIYEEASQSNDAELKKIDEVNTGSLNEYDQVFIGSPIHAGSIANEVKEFFGKLSGLSKIKLAGFITHAAPAYPQQTLEQMAQPFMEVCKDKGIEYKGCFNCQGYLADFMHEAVQKMRKLDDEEWKARVKQMTGHPNDEDVAAAKAFARSILS